ncbi:MAG: hypothetical protein QM775_03115 [Pirellulales bacterium]
MLTGRPVKHGERLLHVADEAGPWQLELDVPQQGYADVAAALRNGPTSATFVVATGPEQTYSARVTELAGGAETTTAAVTTVVARAVFDGGALPADVRRPGAVATARIDCGPSSLGTVWTRDLLHYLRTRWWF